MKESFTYKNYLSPFTYRYGSSQMRGIFSEYNKFLTYRKLWAALAKAQNKLGIVSLKEYKDIVKNIKKIDIEKSQSLEKELRHDIAAELKVFSSQCKTGGGKLHLGATSADIIDNADVLRIKEAFALIEKKLTALLRELAEFIEKYQGLVCMAFTHLQPSEPTTLGYRFCLYAQDFLIDLEEVKKIKQNLKGKGFKGASGTSASYTALFGQNKKKVKKMESEISKDLGIDFFEITSQVYPRKQDYLVLNSLSLVAQSLHKMAHDIRIMQSPNTGEVNEAFEKRQIGSSAMPFKKNPIVSEKICSLARLIKSLPSIAWDNAAGSLLERTLDDSANRRVILPQAFLALDEILSSAVNLIKNLEVNKDNIKRNLRIYGPFSGTEPLMMAMVKLGLSRQELHERLRILSLKAWEEVKEGKPNPLIDIVKQDSYFSKLINSKEIDLLMSPEAHTGNVKSKCKNTIDKIRRI